MDKLNRLLTVPWTNTVFPIKRDYRNADTKCNICVANLIENKFPKLCKWDGKFFESYIISQNFCKSVASWSLWSILIGFLAYFMHKCALFRFWYHYKNDTCTNSFYLTKTISLRWSFNVLKDKHCVVQPTNSQQAIGRAYFIKI